MGCSERRKEIKRRRKRREKIQHFKTKVEKSTVSEKSVIAGKLRDMTPGAEAIIENLSLEER